ncbi:hypothetical protein ACIHCV_40520 [Streptomyces sp. NPDC051956]
MAHRDESTPSAIGKDVGQPPEEEGVQYLSPKQRPAPAEVLAGVYDGR